MLGRLKQFSKTTQLIKIKLRLPAGLSAQRPQSDQLPTSVEQDTESPARRKGA